MAYKIATKVLPSNYVWHIPKDMTPGTNYKIRVYHLPSGIRDESDAPFSVGVPVQITEQPTKRLRLPRYTRPLQSQRTVN